MVELAAASLRRAGRLRLRVTGSSMLPAILPGDVLRVERRDLHDIAPGTVVLFERERRLFAHRVVRREAGSLVTRGDAMGGEDPAVRAHELLGEVTAIERGGRRLSPAPTLLARAAAAVFARCDPAARIFSRILSCRNAA